MFRAVLDFWEKGGRKKETEAAPTSAKSPKVSAKAPPDSSSVAAQS
jgi:hypothetical protein